MWQGPQQSSSYSVLYCVEWGVQCTREATLGQRELKFMPQEPESHQLGATAIDSNNPPPEPLVRDNWTESNPATQPQQ